MLKPSAGQGGPAKSGSDRIEEETIVSKQPLANVLTRRRLLAGTAAAGAAAGAAALGPRVGPRRRARAQGPVEITMWGFPLTQDDQQMFAPIQEAFHAEHPDIQVRVQIEPWIGREEKMLAALAAGNPPDVVYLNPDFYPKFVLAESLVPFTQYLDSDAMADYNPGPVAAVTHNDEVFGLPILTSVFTQMYNQTLTDAAGVTEQPTNWENFRAAVEAVHDPEAGIWGAYLFASRASPVTLFVPFLRMAGGTMFTDDSQTVAFDGPEGIEALDYLTSFYRDGLVQEANLTDGGLPFSAGMTGYMIQVDPSYVRAAQQDNPDLVLGVTPTLEHKRKTNFGTVGSYAMFKQGTDERYEAAATWIKYLTNPENTTTVLSASGFISPRASITPEMYIDQEIFMDMANQAQFMEPEPKSPMMREIFAAMTPEFDAAFLGTKPVEEAIAAAAEASNALLAS